VIMANLDITPNSSQIRQTHSSECPACAMVPMKSRRLTVGYGSATLRLAREWLPEPKPEPAPAPHLRLQGRWLDHAGFRIGANVRVQVTPGRLVIELLEQDA
jgi:Toxin SymE, type I toxin-antitoxin system